MLAAVWFALASAASGFAPTAAVLIVTRVLQGIGATPHHHYRAQPPRRLHRNQGTYLVVGVMR